MIGYWGWMWRSWGWSWEWIPGVSPPNYYNPYPTYSYPPAMELSEAAIEKIADKVVARLSQKLK